VIVANVASYLPISMDHQSLEPLAWSQSWCKQHR
jgi:hypothetical protein